MKTNHLPSRWLCLAIVLLAPVPARADFADDALTVELRALAGQIKGIMDNKGYKTIAVGDFTGSVGRDGNVGPEIQLALQKELGALGFTVDAENFQVEVKGEYFPEKQGPESQPDRKLQGVQLEARVRTADGTAVGAFSRFIFGSETFARMTGRPVSLPPNADDEERSRQFERSLGRDAPPVSVAGSVVRNAAGSPYGMEVLVKGADGSSARGPKAAGITPLVPILKDEVYEVRLINDSAHEAAVLLTIDGISTFAFGDKPYRYTLVPAHTSVVVPGWYLTNEKAQEFKVTDFPHSAAGQLKLSPSRQTGTIAAAFSAAWTSDADKPDDEARGRGLGTGFGDVLDRKSVEVKREIGNMRETVIVRYTR
jgi:hypothetical protein